ncbi:JAB domain-containing protein [Macrococcus bovicus]|uniref:JAB domain-containing protein n=1 Tax=Macrococcus bovicus TaxID=69968 RepID=UPI0025A538FC|nr:DNA repair protein RadC [Macrococcus bovicus]WJP96768.1 DNA repair protein RadC [Macrococcus bovicus]
MKNHLIKLLTKKGQEVVKGLSVEILLNEEYISHIEGLSDTDKKRLMIVSRQFDELSKPKQIDKIKSPQCAYEIMAPILKGKQQEEFHVLCLNTKNLVIHKEMVFKGSLNASIVHPREVFKIAVTHSAANIIVCHNHPSGDPTPSQEDIEATQRLAQCGQLFGIELLDHIIVGDNSFISLKEKGYF